MEDAVNEPVVQSYRYRAEASASIAAGPGALFDYLDDPRRLGSHMQRRSGMMAGGKMGYLLDEREGRGVGAVIRMRGRFLGLVLKLDEVVDTYEPPQRKAWHTVGRPRLIVIGPYRMGYEIRPAAAGSELDVFIHWDAAPGALGPWSRWLGHLYARWCAASTVRDAQRHFQGHAGSPAM